ncbi:tetratricopeptide repeat protein [Vogesella sp. LIG4]|uniref:YfgM family protein n=1 Tax=Vogesella sp. LIG4 TaxID=1192162 RepID=UPI00081FBC2F|nr:tetratricopeptide repeat protein [Vogesella sp. LIG4]SCK20197.1 Putative negative regulator of RcsB-dependent stress response [Vogesella sp. LIG4]
MAYDLQEQEQIDSLKLFWTQWGKLIGGAVLAVSVGFLGFKGWQYYQRTQAEAAAVVYSQLQDQLQAGKLDDVKATVELLERDYRSSQLAANAAMLAAKLAFERNDAGFARAQLKWVLAQSNDETLQAVAHLRLASVLLDDKQFDAALAELGSPHPAAFDSLFLDLKGDVLVARGDNNGARESYKAALAKAALDAPARDFIQTKLDSVGN